MKNEKIKEKKITIDTLAIMIEKGFAATAKQEELLALTKRVECLEQRMDKSEGRADKFEKNINERFDKFLSELKEIRKEIEVNNFKTRGDVTSLDFRVSKLEKKMGLP